MKLIIDIPDGMLEAIKEGTWCGSHKLELAIRNGTPLPKGHGRLIDAEKLANDVNALKDTWNRRFSMNDYERGRWDSYDYVETITIENAPTIIEADKGEE